MSQMKGPMYFRLLPNAEHTTALSGLSTKHWVWTLRHTFLATMLDRKMPDYCVERYLKEDGTRGVKVKYRLFYFLQNENRLGDVKRMDPWCECFCRTQSYPTSS